MAGLPFDASTLNKLPVKPVKPQISDTSFIFYWFILARFNDLMLEVKSDTDKQLNSIDKKIPNVLPYTTYE